MNLVAGCLLSVSYAGSNLQAQTWEPTRPHQPAYQAPVQQANTTAANAESQVRFAGSTSRTRSDAVQHDPAPTRNTASRPVSASQAAYNELVGDSNQKSRPVQPLRWRSPKNPSPLQQASIPDKTEVFAGQTAPQQITPRQAFAGVQKTLAFTQEPLEYSAPVNSAPRELTTANVAPVLVGSQESQVAGPYESQIRLASYQDNGIDLALPPVTRPPQESEATGLSDLTLPPVQNGLDREMGRPEAAPMPNMLDPKREQIGGPNDELAPLSTRPSSERDVRSNPFGDESAPSPADRRGAGEQPAQDDELESPDLTKRSNLSCSERRARFQSRSIQDISLDISPSFGKGLHNTASDAEQERLNFAANAPVREWFNYKGELVTSGRLIDLRGDQIILDVQGTEEKILIQDLSDADLAYVGEAWYLPLDCGTGDPPFQGRDFTQTIYQWSAPGHCHKPLYFQQTQLERYGHSAGPIIQPVLSTAHFFSNIAILPYRMGIHPPNECQYSMGYYRPGDCAPYMMEPLPLSLRGMATQVTAMSGGAALIP